VTLAGTAPALRGGAVISTPGVGLALLLCACTSPAAPAARERAPAESKPVADEAAAQLPAAEAPVPVPEAAPQAAPTPQLFGAALDPNTPELSLSQLLAAPAAHEGKTIRTRGTIQRVCQRMGCWMELQGEGAKSAVRIPMADHAFFLPQNVAGRRAEIQGKVSVAALSDAHKRHLESEGAQATDVNVSIAATGVHVN
jgi:Domain of unknown function (DUF4920)